jgi:glucokinase
MPARPPARLIGIDIGGTAIKAGVLLDTEVVERRSVPLPRGADKGATTILDALAQLARELGFPEHSPRLGIATAGLIDRERELLTLCPNITELEGVAFTDELARRLGVERDAVHLENDANAAALGEQWLGAARDVADVMVVTLGTGIGSGLVLDGRLVIGAGGMAAELGHTLADPAGPPCGCGARGCLEALASATAAKRRAVERGLPREDPGNLELLSERARAQARSKGGPEGELLEEIGLDLGRGFASVVSLLDLRCFVIGGGFGAALDVLLPGIRRGLAERIRAPRVERIEILPAGLGADAGWIGAARTTVNGGPAPE